MDRRESWRGSTVLRRGADKIVVKRKRNGHYVFVSVRVASANGAILDFLQRRRNLSLGAVRQILRPWIGRPAATVPLLPHLDQPAQIGCGSKAPIGAWRTRCGIPIWSTSELCRRPCLARRDLPAGCGSTAVAMPRFRISTPLAGVDTRSMTSDLPALPLGAKRACGF